MKIIAAICFGLLAGWFCNAVLSILDDTRPGQPLTRQQWRDLQPWRDKISAAVALVVGLVVWWWVV